MLNVAIYLSVIGTIGAIGLSIFAYKMHKSKNCKVKSAKPLKRLSLGKSLEVR